MKSILSLLLMCFCLAIEQVHIEELFAHGKGLPNPDHAREERRGRERNEVVARALLYRPRNFEIAA